MNFRNILLIIFIFLNLINTIYVEGKVIYVKGKSCRGIQRIITKKKVIALTFDDGPKSEFLPDILSVLKKHNVKATFFVVGEKIASDQKSQELIKQIVEEGHIIGNHSYTHRKFNSLKINEIKNEIISTSKLIEKITGKYPLLFKPPYGYCTPFLNKFIEENGYTMVMWTLKDINQDNKVGSLEKFILNNVKPGIILLFHENKTVFFGKDRSELTKLLDRIIPALKEKGYQFVTIPELLEVKAYRE